MSNQNNTDLAERTQEALDNATDEQALVISTLVNNDDLEGLFWVLPRIENEIYERLKQDRESERAE